MLMDIKRKLGWPSFYQINSILSQRLQYEIRKDCIIIKGSVQQESLTILNVYAPNMGIANYISQLITKSKKHINNNTIIVGELNRKRKVGKLSLIHI